MFHERPVDFLKLLLLRALLGGAAAHGGREGHKQSARPAGGVHHGDLLPSARLAPQRVIGRSVKVASELREQHRAGRQRVVGAVGLRIVHRGLEQLAGVVHARGGVLLRHFRGVFDEAVEGVLDALRRSLLPHVRGLEHFHGGLEDGLVIVRENAPPRLRQLPRHVPRARHIAEVRQFNGAVSLHKAFMHEAGVHQNQRRLGAGAQFGVFLHVGDAYDGREHAPHAGFAHQGMGGRGDSRFDQVGGLRPLVAHDAGVRQHGRQGVEVAFGEPLPEVQGLAARCFSAGGRRMNAKHICQVRLNAVVVRFQRTQHLPDDAPIAAASGKRLFKARLRRHHHRHDDVAVLLAPVRRPAHHAPHGLHDLHFALALVEEADGVQRRHVDAFRKHVDVGGDVLLAVGVAQTLQFVAAPFGVVAGRKAAGVDDCGFRALAYLLLRQRAAVRPIGKPRVFEQA